MLQDGPDWLALEEGSASPVSVAVASSSTAGFVSAASEPEEPLAATSLPDQAFRGAQAGADDAASIVTEMLSAGGDGAMEEQQDMHELLIMESLPPSDAEAPDQSSEEHMDQLDTVLPLFDVTDGGTSAYGNPGSSSAALVAAAAAAAASAEGVWGSLRSGDSRSAPPASGPAASGTNSGGGRSLAESLQGVGSPHGFSSPSLYDFVPPTVAWVDLYESAEDRTAWSNAGTVGSASAAAGSSMSAVSNPSTLPSASASAPCYGSRSTPTTTVATASSAAANDGMDLSQQFACPICLEVCEDAVETPCCHNLFCQGCLLSDRHVINTCPICKRDLRSSQVLANVPIRRMISDLPCACRFEGCPAQLRRRDRSHHEASCEYSPVSCRHSRKCGQLLRRQLLRHETEECPFRPVVCPMVGCGFILPLDGLDKHLEQDCPRVLCKCSMCGEGVCRAAMHEHTSTACPLAVVMCGLPEEETRTSCTYRCERRSLGDHRRMCVYQPATCRHENCEHVSTCRLLESHEDSCQWRVLPCPDCGADLLLGALQEHLETDCPEHMVACPFAEHGCNDFTPRRLMSDHLAQACGVHLAQLCEAVAVRDVEIRHLKAEVANVRSDFEQRLDRLERTQGMAYGGGGGFGLGARRGGSPSGGGDRLPELASMTTAWASPAAATPTIVARFGADHGGGGSGSGGPFTDNGGRFSGDGGRPDAAAPNSTLRSMLRNGSRILASQQRVVPGGMPAPYPMVADERPFSRQQLGPLASLARARERGIVALQQQQHQHDGGREDHSPPSTARTSSSVFSHPPPWERDFPPSPPGSSPPFLLRDTGVSTAPVLLHSGGNPFGGAATSRPHRYNGLRLGHGATAGSNRHGPTPTFSPTQRRAGGFHNPVGYRAAVSSSGGGSGGAAAPGTSASGSAPALGPPLLGIGSLPPGAQDISAAAVRVRGMAAMAAAAAAAIAAGSHSGPSSPSGEGGMGNHMGTSGSMEVMMNNTAAGNRRIGAISFGASGLVAGSDLQEVEEPLLEL